MVDRRPEVIPQQPSQQTVGRSAETTSQEREEEGGEMKEEGRGEMREEKEER